MGNRVRNMEIFFMSINDLMFDDVIVFYIWKFFCEETFYWIWYLLENYIMKTRNKNKIPSYLDDE